MDSQFLQGRLYNSSESKTKEIIDVQAMHNIYKMDGHKFILSHGSDIMLCIKIDKPLVVYIFSNVMK